MHNESTGHGDNLAVSQGTGGHYGILTWQACWVTRRDACWVLWQITEHDESLNKATR